MVERWLLAAAVCLVAGVADAGADVPLNWKPAPAPKKGQVAKVPHATVSASVVQHAELGQLVTIDVEFDDGTKCGAIRDQGASVFCGRYYSQYIFSCALEAGRLACALEWTSPEGRAVGEK